MAHHDGQASPSRSQALELLAAVDEADRELRRPRDGLAALLGGGED